MNILVRMHVGREQLVWATAYCLNRNLLPPGPNRLPRKTTKSLALEFLRSQLHEFGTHMDTLAGANWQDDLADQLPEAERLVTLWWGDDP